MKKNNLCLDQNVDEMKKLFSARDCQANILCIRDFLKKPYRNQESSCKEVEESSFARFYLNLSSVFVKNCVDDGVVFLW